MKHLGLIALGALAVAIVGLWLGWHYGLQP